MEFSVVCQIVFRHISCAQICLGVCHFALLLLDALKLTSTCSCATLMLLISFFPWRRNVAQVSIAELKCVFIRDSIEYDGSLLSYLKVDSLLLIVLIGIRKEFRMRESGLIIFRGTKVGLVGTPFLVRQNHR